MFTIYRINADELDETFLESLKAAFRHKEIEIAVGETDETEYLLRAPANRAHLLAAVADVEAGATSSCPSRRRFDEAGAFSSGGVPAFHGLGLR